MELKTGDRLSCKRIRGFKPVDLALQSIFGAFHDATYYEHDKQRWVIEFRIKKGFCTTPYDKWVKWRKDDGVEITVYRPKKEIDEILFMNRLAESRDKDYDNVGVFWYQATYTILKQFIPALKWYGWTSAGSRTTDEFWCSENHGYLVDEPEWWKMTTKIDLERYEKLEDV